jgi:hypothetical protein
VKKTELIKLMSANTGLTGEQTRRFIDELVLLAGLRLKMGGDFAIADLVEITAVDKPARGGVAMGKAWSKPAHRALKAKIIGRAKRMFEAGS